MTEQCQLNLDYGIDYYKNKMREINGWGFQFCNEQINELKNKLINVSIESYQQLIDIVEEFIAKQ